MGWLVLSKDSLESNINWHINSLVISEQKQETLTATFVGQQPTIFGAT